MSDLPNNSIVRIPNRFGILLLHGLTGMPSEMRPIEKSFRQLGYVVSAPILAGHGGSNDELLNCTWKDWVNGVIAARDELLTQCEKIVICGLSMGALLATIAADDKRVVGVVLLSPTLSYDGSSIDAFAYQRYTRSRLIQSLLHSAVHTLPILGRNCYWTESPPYGLKDERLQRQITKAIDAAKRGESNEFGLFRTYFASLYQMNLLSDYFREKAPRTKCPVLILHSLEDTIASIANATETYALLGSKNKTITFVTGCDHVLTLDLKRKQVLHMIDSFVNEVMHGKVKEQTVPFDHRPFLNITVKPNLAFNQHDKKVFDQLFPEQCQSIKLVDYMQELGSRFITGHSIIARNNNVPLMVFPAFLNIGNLSKSASKILEKLSLVLGGPFKSLVRTNLMGIGITEEEFGNVAISKNMDDESRQEAWVFSLRVVKALSQSLRARVVFLNHKDINIVAMPNIKKQSKIVSLKQLQHQVKVHK